MAGFFYALSPVYNNAANTVLTGSAYTCNAIGNPTSYYNGASHTMTWQHGRQLESLTKGTAGASYAYDKDGVRSSKTVGSTTYSYITQSGLAVRQTGGGNTLDFFCDAAQRSYALRCMPTDGTAAAYYYVLNLQGDYVARAFGLISAAATISNFSVAANPKLNPPAPAKRSKVSNIPTLLPVL